MKHFLSFAILASIGCQSPTGADYEPYPLNTCIVTDNELGSMGDPIVMMHGDQQVKFCCEPCVEEFEADPDSFLAKLQR